MLESDYTHAESPKPSPEVPVRVFLKSQLMAALRQHSRPIVIEDPDLALPFTRMLQARELRLKSVGGLVAEAMSYAIRRHYSADVEAHWYIGQYVLPGNVQRIILSRTLFRFVRCAPACRRILGDTANSAGRHSTPPTHHHDSGNCLDAAFLRCAAVPEADMGTRYLGSGCRPDDALRERLSPLGLQRLFTLALDTPNEPVP